jgi:hypothetical protein
MSVGIMDKLVTEILLLMNKSLLSCRLFLFDKISMPVPPLLISRIKKNENQTKEDGKRKGIRGRND